MPIQFVVRTEVLFFHAFKAIRCKCTKNRFFFNKKERYARKEMTLALSFPLRLIKKGNACSSLSICHSPITIFISKILNLNFNQTIDSSLFINTKGGLYYPRLLIISPIFLVQNTTGIKNQQLFRLIE